MGDVDEHASADDPMRGRRDVQTASTSACDAIRWPTVIELALVGDVAKGVYVRVAVTMKLHSQEVRGEADVTRAAVNVMRGVYVVKSGIGIVWAGDGIDRQR